MAHISIIGSGLMALLASKCLRNSQLSSSLKPSACSLQHTLVNHHRAQWLKAKGLWCSSYSEIYGMRIVAQGHHCSIANSQPLAYLVNNQTWISELSHIPPNSSQSTAFDWQLIAAGAEPDFLLPQSIVTHRHDFQQYATFTHIRHEHAHLNIATQSFNQRGITASLPLGEQNESIIITSTPMNLYNADFSLPGDMRPYLGEHIVLGHTKAKTLKSILRYPAMKGKILLLGDSRLQMHPLAGQGLNAGLYALEDLVGRLGHKMLDRKTAYEHVQATQPHLNRLHIMTTTLAKTTQYTSLRHLLGLTLSLLEQQAWLKTGIKIIADPLV